MYLLQDANTSSLKSIDLAQQLFAIKENGDATEYFLDVSNPLMRAVECLGLTLTALEFIGMFLLFGESRVLLLEHSYNLPKFPPPPLFIF